VITHETKVAGWADRVHELRAGSVAHESVKMGAAAG
jgi:ABC-type lipoprotein export system ATPase subunit